MEIIERFRGSLLGLAAGDALGTTLEFKPAGSFAPISEIVGGGPFRLKPGEWTDDTSMALCLADSLIESNEFDATDQMQRYCRWRAEGYLSSNGRCFDIGATVASALSKFKTDGDPFAGSTDPSSAGNGSLMRLAPVVLFYAADAAKAIHYAGESSRTTHGAPEAVDACRYMAALIIGALQGKSKDEILSPMFAPVSGLWEAAPLAPKIEAIARGSFKSEEPVRLSGTGGYVVPSLEIALWAFYHAGDFRDGALKAVNVGHDADTYGAIYGQLAGSFFGASSIPQEWRGVLAKRDLIESLADGLLKQSAAL